MKIWITSDTHFNHKKLVELEGRPENFNELIISNHNKQFAPDDMLIHLGDVILGKHATLNEFLSKFNVKHKILVRGNHDHKPNAWYMEKGFTFVCDYFVWKDIAFSHAPLTPLPRCGQEHYKEEVKLNIHGHFHSNGHRILPGREDAYFNAEYYTKHTNSYYLVHIEKTFRPVLLDTILAERGLA